MGWVKGSGMTWVRIGKASNTGNIGMGNGRVASGRRKVTKK